MFSFRIITFGAGLLLASAALTSANGAAKKAPASMPDTLLQDLEASNGQLTPQVRADYLDWAGQTVLDQLAAANVTVADSCLAEINADSTVRDAMFGAVYPPDPSILQNYAYLRDALGPAFLQKYRSLVVGIAVMRRCHGVAAVKPAPVKKSADDGDDTDITPADQISDPAAANETPPPQNNQVVVEIAKYMQMTLVTALQLYQDPGEKQKLFDFLKTQGIPDRVLDQDQHGDRFVALLKSAMVQLGQRPAHREAGPDQVTWLRYLASIYEAKPSSVPKGKGWPLFPLDSAPWPLLMPMSHTVPLGEAQYIWEKYQGEHGPDRFHSYGPYREPPQVVPYELQPMPWSWGAWPSRIQAGGECVVMSGITVDLYSALGKPSIRAAQPHHSNLISFRDDRGQWYAVIEQAFAGGPPVTHAMWPFHESIGAPRMYGDAGSEYHLGLAQAMNVGLKSYLDTRIAVNLYHMLPASDQKTLGVNLLTQAIATNPFNAEAWYLLAQQTTNATQGLALAQAAKSRNPGGVNTDAAAGAKPSLVNWTETEQARPVEASEAEYWRTLEQFLIRLSILNHPMPADETAARNIYNFLKDGAPGVSFPDYDAYTLRFVEDGSPP
jgi:hypothetical protein